MGLGLARRGHLRLECHRRLLIACAHLGLIPVGAFPQGRGGVELNLRRVGLGPRA